MSAIFNTLKKLEEEKSSLDPAISMENLIFHDGDFESPESFLEKPRPWRGKILLIAGGIILGAVIGRFL